MIRQYLMFFLNGGIIGVAAWALQWLIFYLIGDESGPAYGLATALTYGPLLVLNFLVQRSWIFKRSGLFTRFLVANLLIMVLVSVLSPGFRFIVDWLVAPPWGDRTGFMLAALTGSVPSFLIQRHWVFGHDPDAGSTLKDGVPGA